MLDSILLDPIIHQKTSSWWIDYHKRPKFEFQSSVQPRMAFMLHYMKYSYSFENKANDSCIYGLHGLSIRIIKLEFLMRNGLFY